MKKGIFKRLTAVLLLVGILASFVVPVSFAGDDDADRVVETYDIYLYDSTLKKTEGYNTLLPSWSNSTGKPKHTQMMICAPGIETAYNATSGVMINWMPVATKSTEGWQYRSDADAMLRLNGGAANWGAIKIRVPESGKFALTYTTGKAFSGTVSAYVFPVSDLAGDTSSTKIESLMIPANSVGTKAYADVITFDEKDYTEGEYVVVYQGTSNNIYLTELALVDFADGSSETTENTETTETTATLETIVYDLLLYDADLPKNQGYNTLIASWSNSTGKPKINTMGLCKPLIEAAYAATEGITINWAPIAAKAESAWEYRGDSNYVLRLRNGTEGNWGAIKIRVDVAGQYVLNFSTDITLAANDGKVTAFVFPVSALEGDISAEKIESMLNWETNLGERTMTATDNTVTFDAKDYAAGEYVVVYIGESNDTFLTELALVDANATPEDPTDETTQGTTTETTNSATDGTTQGTTNETTQAATNPSSETTAPSTGGATDPSNPMYTPNVYDMWLYDANLARNEGYNTLIASWSNSTGKPKLNTMIGCKPKIDAAYAATEGVTINWAPLGVENNDNWKYQTGSEGYLLLLYRSNWGAFKIRVSEGGRFALAYSTDITYGANKANIEAYVFPVSALEGDSSNAKIESLMTAENSVGTRKMTAEDSTVYFAAKDYEAGEYVVVYKSEDDKIYLSELALVDASTVPEEPTEESTEAPTEAPTVPETRPAVPENTGDMLPQIVYDFELYKNLAFKEDVTTMTWDEAKGRFAADFQSHRFYDGASLTAGDHTVVSWFIDHYPAQINWGLETPNGANNSYKDYAFRGKNAQGLRLEAYKEGQFVSLRISVGQAGSYNLTALTGDQTAEMDIYVLKATTDYSTARMSKADLKAAIRGANQLADDVNMVAGKQVNLGAWYFPEAGDYILVFAPDETLSASASLKTITLTDTRVVLELPEGGSNLTVEDGTYTDNLFNFELYKEEARKEMFGTVSRDLGQKCYHCGKTVKECIKEQYADGKLNWVFEGSDFLEKSLLNSSYLSTGAGGFFFRYTTDENGKPIMAINKHGKEIKTSAVGNVIALRVNVTKTGKFAVNVNKAFQANQTADVYIFPAPQSTMTRAEFLAAAKEEYYVGAAEFSGKMTQSVVGEYDFAATGEYIVLFKTTGTTTSWYMDSISLEVPKVAEPIPTTKEQKYNFDLSKDDPTLVAKSSGSKYISGTQYFVSNWLEDQYAEGKSLWKFETSGGTINAPTFRAGCLRFRNKSGNFRKFENAWYAFRIKNPGTATYDIRLVTSAASQSVADVYLIPAKSEMILTKDQIQAAMTDANRVVKGAIFDKKETFYLGEYTFGMEEEYVLVFDFQKGATLFIQEIIMSLDGVRGDGTVKKEKVYNGTVYDFDQGDQLNGVFTSANTYVSMVLDKLNTMWRTGELNWKWENASDGLIEVDKNGKATPVLKLSRFYRYGGYRVYGTSEGAWSAFRIKSPGSGTFTVSLEHAQMVSGGVAAIYILPGDTQDIEKAMDPKNRVGKVIMYNDGSDKLVDGIHTYLGYWDFEAGKEYIVVFESYEISPYNTYSYMNFSQLICERGKLDYETEEAEKKVAPIIAADNIMVTGDATAGAVLSEIGGHKYLFVPMEGECMIIYDVDTDELVGRVTGLFKRPETCAIDQDGNIWIGGQSKFLVRYNPITGEVFKTKNFTKVPGLEGANGSYSVYPAANGKIYFGTYYDGRVHCYDPETNTFELIADVRYGVNKGTGVKIRSVQQLGDYLYFISSNNVYDIIYKYDLNTKQIVQTLDVSACKSTTEYVGGFAQIGNGELFMLGTGGGAYSGCTAVDPVTMELVDIGLPNMISGRPSEVYNGKQYFVVSGYGIYSYDVETKEFAKVPGMNSAIGFKSSNNLVTIDGQQYLLTFNKSVELRLYDMVNYEERAWASLSQYGTGASDVRGFANGPEGSNEIYIGAFNNHKIAVFNTKTNTMTKISKAAGQTDSQIFYEGKHYTGSYSSTTLNEMYVDTEEWIQRWRLDHEETGQKRVHGLTAGDGYIFAGTIPDKQYVGGSIVVYDTRTGRWFYDREASKQLAVPQLVYHDKLLFAATTMSGGYAVNNIDSSKLSSLILVYDYEKRETIATLDPRDYISGLPSQIPLIGCIAKDPAVDGRFWSIVSETLFCFTFDREKLTFDVQEVISFDKSKVYDGGGRTTNCRNMLFDVETKSIYVTFDDNGGFQRIVLQDWDAPQGQVKVESNARIMNLRASMILFSEDGDLYFGAGTDLMMLPLNVTDEDWAIAGAVDEMIKKACEDVTLESETAIKEARSAYENLSLRYKALVQSLEALQEAETDLLECMIDTIEIDKVDADTLPLLQGYMDVYNAFNARQQKYTKNYDALSAAYIKATGLNDERVAAAMQKRINDLKDKFPLTLDHEPEVVGIRADFNALTAGQRVLVDTAILEEAEAQIAELRKEFVKYVESLIQAIPKEITLDAEPAITAAREAADKLYMQERKLVSYSKLTSAEGKLRTLKKAKAAAEEVDALIKEIGIVTLGDKDRIAAARDAYDSLNNTALQFVTKEGKLKAAEFILKALQTWGIPAITVANAGIVFAILWFIPSLHSKVFKAKKKEEEVIDN